jgi:hypothetical protein
VSESEQTIECRCYHVCAGLGLETKQWCRYRKSDLPPTGMHRFDPKEDWCPTGVQASVLMLGYMLSGETGDPERLRPALEQVRKWARELRRERTDYDPARSAER